MMKEDQLWTVEPLLQPLISGETKISLG
jgi:hypothetical protein